MSLSVNFITFSVRLRTHTLPVSRFYALAYSLARCSEGGSYGMVL